MANLGTGLHGIRSGSPDNLLIDVGTLYLGIDLTALRADPSPADPVGDAIASAQLLGATQGGASFSTGKSMRHVEIDGMRFPIKEMQRIDEYQPTLTVTLLEWTRTNLQTFLGQYSRTIYDNYEEINPDIVVAATDYYANIALTATLVGDPDPIILVLENALVTEALDVTLEDKSEAAVEVTFLAHATDASPDTSPVHFFWPATAPAS